MKGTQGMRQQVIKPQSALIDSCGQGQPATTSAEQHAATSIDLRILDATDPLLAIGRLQGLEFVRRVADVAAAQVFNQLKNSNKIIGLPFTAADGTVRHVANLDEFCQHYLGKSSRRMYELSANLSVLGTDLYEQSERIGFRARDYQALKALPADEQAMVKGAIESGSRDQAIDLLTELAARNHALLQKEAESKKSLDAKDKVIKAKGATIDKLEEQLAARDHLPANEQEQMQLDELQAASVAAVNALTRLAATADRVLTEPATESSELCARQSIDYVVQRMVDACMERGISCDLADRVTPIWAAPLVEAAANSKLVHRSAGAQAGPQG